MLHDHTRHRGDSNLPVVLQIFLFIPFLENESYVSPSPVTWNFTGLPQFSSYNEQRLCKLIHHFSQDPQRYLIMSQELVYFQDSLDALKPNPAKGGSSFSQS